MHGIGLPGEVVPVVVFRNIGAVSVTHQKT